MEFRIEKIMKKKVKNNQMLSGKAIIQLMAGWIKRQSIKMSQYFPKPYERYG